MTDCILGEHSSVPIDPFNHGERVNWLLITHRVRDTRQWEGSRKLDHILLQLSQKFGRLVRLITVCGDEIFEELGPSFLLGGQRDLNGSMKEVGNDFHIFLDHRTGGQCGETDSDTTRDLSGGCENQKILLSNVLSCSLDPCGLTITLNRILVDGDMTLVTNLLNLASSQTQRPQIPQDQMILGPIGLKLVFVREENLGDGLRVLDDLFGVGLEGGIGSLLKSDGDTGNGLWKMGHKSCNR